MQKIIFYEPAMCCPTGLCGVNVNPELLRISTITNHLIKNGIEVTRFNLSSNPNAFVSNREIQQFVRRFGVKVLPITVVNGKVVKTNVYPSNQEIVTFLNITEAYLCSDIGSDKKNESKSCECTGGCC